MTEFRWKYYTSWKMSKYITILFTFFRKQWKKPGVSLYHLNLLHLQMDIAWFSFDFLKEKRNKSDHFVTLTHVNSRWHLFWIRLLKTFLQPTFGHVIKGIFETSHIQIEWKMCHVCLFQFLSKGHVHKYETSLWTLANWEKYLFCYKMIIFTVTVLKISENMYIIDI